MKASIYIVAPYKSWGLDFALKALRAIATLNNNNNKKQAMAKALFLATDIAHLQWVAQLPL